MTSMAASLVKNVASPLAYAAMTMASQIIVVPKTKAGIITGLLAAWVINRMTAPEHMIGEYSVTVIAWRSTEDTVHRNQGYIDVARRTDSAKAMAARVISPIKAST